MTEYEGYFRTYTDAEELESGSLSPEELEGFKSMSLSDVDVAAEKLKNVEEQMKAFERLVLEKIQEEFSEEWAAIAEYYTVYEGGFWNDPILYEPDQSGFTEELAERVAQRSIENLKNQGQNIERGYILNEADLQ